jgi:cold shock CspA family protein
MTLRRGIVAAFDDAAGFGAVRDDDGNEHFFHCTAIADGTRTIAVGTAVTFVVVPGRRGRWEAAAVSPVSSPAEAGPQA